MSVIAVRLALVVLCGLGIALGIAGMRLPLSGEETPPPLPQSASDEAQGPSLRDSAWHMAAERAPFRASRRLADVAYDPNRREPTASSVPTGPPKPSLRVSGIVWGQAPVVVIEGLPGTTGPRAAQQGDTVGGVTVHRIERARVILTGFDTTWTLTVRMPWQ